jgi:hypothetical protein
MPHRPLATAFARLKRGKMIQELNARPGIQKNTFRGEM